MDTLGKICPFMSRKMNYQYCIEECAFYDTYVGCYIMFTLNQINTNSENINFTIQDIVRRLND